MGIASITFNPRTDIPPRVVVAMKRTLSARTRESLVIYSRSRIDEFVRGGLFTG